MLKKLAEQCEFGDALNDTLGDRLVRVWGIQKGPLTKKQREDSLAKSK